jgi:membrane-associated phospholipid phosphatase
LRIIHVLLMTGIFYGSMQRASAQTDTTTLAKDSIAPSSDTTIRYRINGKYLGSIWQDLKYTVARPAHWEKKQWVQFGVVMTTTGVLLAGDYEIKQFFNHNHASVLSQVSRRVEPFGNSYSPWLIGGLYVTSLITHNRELEHGSLMTAKSLIISTIIYSAIKSTIRRERPSYTEHPFNIDPPFSGNKKYTSFPSGHTLTVTTVATALSELYGQRYPWVPWVAYGVAGLTGISRLYDDRHWSSDVWIGASLGFFVTKSVFRHHREQEQKLKRRQLIKY